MVEEPKELNRLEHTILETLYVFGSKDKFHGLTIGEIIEQNENYLASRMTVWKKARKLVNAGYLKKGVVDDHADTYYLSKSGIELIESVKENG